jgi:hypothetical protein
MQHCWPEPAGVARGERLRVAPVIRRPAVYGCDRCSRAVRSSGVALSGPDVHWRNGKLIGVPCVVRIGGADRRSLRESLRTHGVLLNHAAELLFDDRRFTPLGEPRALEIMCFSVAALGFSASATYDQLVTRAAELGFGESPLELAAHLRLQFHCQLEVPSPPSRSRAPAGSLTVASRALDDSEETPKGFYLRRQDEALWLRGYWAPASHLWDAGDVVVFSRPVGAH